MLTINDIIKSVGSNKIESLYRKTNNRYFNPEIVEKYIQEKLSVAHYLGLHESKNKTLIDIGTGAGWFPYICKLYNHRCIGTDVLGRSEYDPIYEALKIEVTGDLVYARQPFGLNIKAHYIISLRSFFPNRPTVWEMEDWKYFFRDIKKNILKDGGIYLGCNTGQKGKYSSPPNSHWGAVEVGNIFKNFHVQPSKELKIKPNTLYIKYNDIVQLGE